MRDKLRSDDTNCHKCFAPFDQPALEIGLSVSRSHDSLSVEPEGGDSLVELLDCSSKLGGEAVLPPVNIPGLINQVMGDHGPCVLERSRYLNLEHNLLNSGRKLESFMESDPTDVSCRVKTKDIGRLLSGVTQPYIDGVVDGG